MNRWIMIRATSPSGKQLFVCSCCGRTSPTPDKTCPFPAQVNDGAGTRYPVDCVYWEKERDLQDELNARRYVDFWLMGGSVTKRTLLINDWHIVLSEEWVDRPSKDVVIVVRAVDYIDAALALHRAQSESKARVDLQVKKSNLKAP